MASIQDFKKTFIPYLQFAAWLLALVTPFVVPPPFDLPGDDQLVGTFTKFFLAIFLALFSYPLIKYKKPGQAGRWWFAGIIFFVAGIIVSCVYLYEYKNKTVYYQTGDKEFRTMVIGNTLTKEAIDASADILKSKSVVNNADLLRVFSVGKVDDLQEIWVKSGIDFNNFFLLGMHSLVIFILAALVLSTVQAVKIKP